MRLFFLFISVAMFTVYNASAQETKKVIKEKKVIIIEKDKNGKTIRKEIIGTDEDDMEIELKDFDVDSLIEVIINEKDVKGKVDKKEQTKNIEVKVDTESGEKEVIIRIKNGGEEEIYKFTGEDGDEIPSEYEVEVDETWVDVEELAQPKVSLGVAISGSAKIEAVLENSAAYEAGLQMGDIIKKIDDQIIYSHRGLLEHLTSYKEGDKVLVSYERNKMLSTTELILKARN